MSVWILVIAILGADGSTAVKLLNSPTPQNNNRETCMAAGTSLEAKLSESFGKNVKIIWSCQEMTKEEFDRALPPSI